MAKLSQLILAHAQGQFQTYSSLGGGDSISFTRGLHSPLREL